MADKEIIDRETYKKIKKMNREELTKFILKYGDELLEQQGVKAIPHRTCAEDAPTDFSSDCIEIPQAY